VLIYCLPSLHLNECEGGEKKVVPEDEIGTNINNARH
jgi:hypothetical protein